MPLLRAPGRWQGYEVGHKRVFQADEDHGAVVDLPAAENDGPVPGTQDLSYLLRDQVIDRPNQTWCADITYLPIRRGFPYLVADMDWHSRKVLS